MDLETVSERIATGRIGHAVSRLVPANPIWEREWDVCCVLDGCRLDLMRELSAAGHDALPGPDRGDSLWSVGSQSAEWMDRTFAPRYRGDGPNRLRHRQPFRRSPAEHLSSRLATSLPLEADDFGVFHEAWRDGVGRRRHFDDPARPSRTPRSRSGATGRSWVSTTCSSTTCSPTRPSGRSRGGSSARPTSSTGGQFTDGESSAADEDFDPTTSRPREREALEALAEAEAETTRRIR